MSFAVMRPAQSGVGFAFVIEPSSQYIAWAIAMRSLAIFSRGLLFATWSKNVCGTAILCGSTAADHHARYSSTRSNLPSCANWHTNLQKGAMITGWTFTVVWRRAD